MELNALIKKLKSSGRSSRRTKAQEQAFLERIEDELEGLRTRMAEAAEFDNEGRKAGEPAFAKLQLLPTVRKHLRNNAYMHILVDPEINLLEGVRFFLEPLSDGSLPSYEIQREIFAALLNLPLTKAALAASGIGKVINFYTKSKHSEPEIRRQAERLHRTWQSLILRMPDNPREMQFKTALYNPRCIA